MRKIFTLLFMLCTSVMALQAQYTEDFEAGSTGWTAENIWQYGNSASNGSAYFPIPSHTNFMSCNDDAAGNGVDGSGRLISPPFDLTGLDFPFLRFDAFFPNLDFGGANETAKVFVSDNGGADWKEVADLTGGGTDWYTPIVDVSDYGNQTIQIAFEYNDGNAWNYGLAVDDIEFYQGPANDVRLSFFDITRFRPAGDMPVTINITNQGYETLTSVDFTWTEGGDVNTETISGLNIAPLQTATVVHPTSFAKGVNANQYDIAVNISNPNGEVDVNMMDNDMMGTASFIVDVPNKVVVGEEKTGTWCPWCPRGEVFLNQMVDDNPTTFIGIAVHNADPMAITEYDNALSNAFAGGYPNVVMSRNRIIDPSAMPGQFDELLSRTSPVSVSGSAKFNGTSNAIDVSMMVTSHTEVSGVEFNVSAILIEDGLTGTGPDWAQANNYAGGGQGPMGGYENLPNPVPASDMVYNHVAKALIGGFLGDDSFVPASLVDGQASMANLSGAVPAGTDLENAHVVLVVTDRATGEIHNALQVSIAGLYPKFSSSALEGCGPFEVEFTDNSDSTASYAWTFDGGTPATSTEKNPVVVFDGAGYHDVSLTAISNSGLSYTITQEDLIFLDKQPASEFSYTEPTANTIEFDDESTDAFVYAWDFGDGVSSVKRNPSHTYAGPGLYDVTLTTENGTCTDVITKTVNVGSVNVKDIIEASWSLTANPNPFTEDVIINYDLSADGGQSQLVVYNYMGQELLTKDLNNQSGYVQLGAELSQGIFFVQVRKDQQVSEILKITKIK